MPTFIKTGLWDKKIKGYLGELNLDNLINTIAPTDRIYSGSYQMIIDNLGTVTTNANIVPTTLAQTLGTPEKPWAEVYVSPGSIYIADENPANLPVKLTNANQYLQVSQGGLKVRSNDDTHETLQLDSTGKFILKSTQPLDANSPAMLILGNVAGQALPGSNPSMITVQGLRDFTTRMYLDGIGFDTTLGVSAHAAYIGRQARGSVVAPTQSLANDIVAVFGGNPYSTGTGFGELSSAAIKFISSENQTATRRGSKVELWATPIGSVNDVRIFTFDQNGIRFTNNTVQSTAYIPPTSQSFNPRFEDVSGTLSGVDVKAYYTMIAPKICYFRLYVNFSSCTNFGTGQYQFTLPFRSIETMRQAGGTLHQNTGASLYHIAGITDVEIDPSIHKLYYSGSTTDLAWRAATPVGATTVTSHFDISGTYEIV